MKGIEKRLRIEEKKNEKLHQMLDDERKRVAGYQEAEKLYTSYISILIKKLGATREDKGVIISKAEFTKSFENGFVRANFNAEKEEYSLWCEDEEK